MNQQTDYYQYQAPFGTLGLQLTQAVLTAVDLQADTSRLVREADKAIAPYFAALDAYFSGQSTHFDVPIRFTTGTVFQNKVWQQIAAIDYGHTLTYSDIAQNLDSHARAVGQACGRNPIPIIVPCHRVLAKNGLGGFSLGREKNMLSIKQYLLKIEGVL